MIDLQVASINRGPLDSQCSPVSTSISRKVRSRKPPRKRQRLERVACGSIAGLQAVASGLLEGFVGDRRIDAALHQSVTESRVHGVAAIGEDLHASICRFGWGTTITAAGSRKP